MSNKGKIIEKLIMGNEPCQMTCEHGNCQCHEGMDYKRRPSEEVCGWEGEPIFLCKEHAEDRIPLHQ